METIKITRQVMIGLDELLKEDIPAIEPEDLALIASKLIDRNRELTEEIKALNLSVRHQESKKTSASPDDIGFAESGAKVEVLFEDEFEEDLASAEKIITKATVNDGTLGKKIGKSSKYHFVNVQMRDGKFYNYKASTSIAGKTVGMGGSKDEIQCALMADEYLDGIGDKDRKRNRDDFPEVMTVVSSAEGGSDEVAKA